MGTTLKELERQNGRPFLIRNWGTDGGGAIRSWRGGALERLQKDTPPVFTGLILDLGIPADVYESKSGISGEGLLLSNSKALRRLKLRVVHLAVAFP
jgi:hypothetical protein